jgi:hypothetical protein
LIIVLVVVLIVLVVTLVIIANIMRIVRGRKDLDGRDVEILEQRFGWSRLYSGSSAIRIETAGVVFTIYLYESVQGAMGISLTRGYQPYLNQLLSHRTLARSLRTVMALPLAADQLTSLPANICMNALADP